MKIFTVLMVVFGLMFSTSVLAMDFEKNIITVSASGPNGPAPNSGDGIPDGSGNDAPYGSYLGN